MQPPEEVETYIASFPPEVSDRLREVRRAILDQVPGGEEKFRYGLAAVMLGDRYALHYGGWKKHIGIYPVGGLSDELESRVAPYRSTKATVAFPHNQPFPLELISEITAEIVSRRQD